MRGATMGVALSLLSIGCGGSAPTSAPKTASLDCAWIVGDNCWKQAAAQAMSCLPSASETGLFSSDLATCSYTSGAVVTFDPPLMTPIVPFDTEKFTVARAGATCLQFEQTSTDLVVTVAGQTVRSSRPGGTTLSVTCPDGTTYVTDDAPALQNCISDPTLQFGGAPAYTVTYGTGTLAVGLLNASSTTWDTQWVFDCSVD
jgi:hypothetical protein